MLVFGCMRIEGFDLGRVYVVSLEGLVCGYLAECDGEHVRYRVLALWQS